MRLNCTFSNDPAFWNKVLLTDLWQYYNKLYPQAKLSKCTSFSNPRSSKVAIDKTLEQLKDLNLYKSKLQVLLYLYILSRANQVGKVMLLLEVFYLIRAIFYKCLPIIFNNVFILILVNSNTLMRKRNEIKIKFYHSKSYTF